MTTIVEQIAAHVSRPLSESDRGRARFHLVDWLACVAGGRRSPVAAAVRGLSDPIERAALLGNVMEMDDVHRVARLHPGPVVWPAALMAGAATPGALAEAAIAGYEAMIALGETLDDRHYAHWHPTATAGMFGAAAAAARAMGLDEGRTADALGHAASLAGGLWHMRHGDSMTKQVHVLHAATAGVHSARLAAAGLTGAIGSVEGEQGLYAAMTDRPEALRLSDGWKMAEVSFKPWAACRHAHPAIDAALELGRAEGPILVATYRDALTFCDRPDPATAGEARFSIQHAVAVAMTHGKVLPEHFEPAAIAALAAERARVSVREDADFSARYPAHFGARISAEGRSVERIDTLGDPERPLDEAAINAKLATLCAWGGLPADAPAEAERAIDSGPAALIALLDGWTR